MDFADMYDFDERRARALDMLKLVGLEQFANKLPVLVSTGQQQLAAIARALACDPPLLVADEPTGNLDSRSSEEIIELFSQLVLQGKTIILVIHDPSITKRTTRTLTISDGLIINETVVKALPLLRHSQMLKVTQILEHMLIPAGNTIIHKASMLITSS